jgi:hypothetical protein
MKCENPRNENIVRWRCGEAKDGKTIFAINTEKSKFVLRLLCALILSLSLSVEAFLAAK